MVFRAKRRAIQNYKLLITFVACLLVFAGGRWFERQVEKNNYSGSYHGAYLTSGQDAEINANLSFDKLVHTALLRLSLWHNVTQQQEDVYIEFDTSSLEHKTLFKSRVSHLTSLNDQQGDKQLTKIIPMAIRYLKGQVVLIIDDRGLFSISDDEIGSVDSKMVFIMKKDS